MRVGFEVVLGVEDEREVSGVDERKRSRTGGSRSMGLQADCGCNRDCSFGGERERSGWTRDKLITGEGFCRRCV